MIVRAWYSAAGAEQGTPWRVEYDDGTFALVESFELCGVARGRFDPKGFALPDGPRAVVEFSGLVMGSPGALGL